MECSFTNRSMCSIVDKLSDKSLLDDPNISIESLLIHASSCETCTNRLDKLDPEILESLFLQDLSPIEEYQHEDPEDSEQSRAVHEVLIPSLGTNAQTTAKAVVEKHGAYAIYAACEAVSSLIRRHQRLKNKNDESIYLLLDGSIKIGTEIIISKQSVASEIANIADIWESTSVREPSDEAYLLASWMFEAARDLPTLLCHYKAHPHSEDCLSLKTVKTSVRIDDVSKRWNHVDELQHKESSEFQALPRSGKDDLTSCQSPLYSRHARICMIAYYIYRHRIYLNRISDDKDDYFKAEYINYLIEQRGMEFPMMHHELISLIKLAYGIFDYAYFLKKGNPWLSDLECFVRAECIYLSRKQFKTRTPSESNYEPRRARAA